MSYDSVKFVLARANRPDAKGHVYTKEALQEMQEKISKDKTIPLKDSKGSYDARVYHCYVEGDCLMVEVEVR